MQGGKILAKDTEIKSIFEKMEYGDVFENNDLVKDWLRKHDGQVFSYSDDKNQGYKEHPHDIKDINTGENLCTVYSSDSSCTKKIFSSYKKNTCWFTMKPIYRAILINRLADEINKASQLICQLEMSIRGILSIDTKTKSLPLLIDYLRYYSSWAANTDFVLPDPGVAVTFIDDDVFAGFLGFILGSGLAAGYKLLLYTKNQISPLILLIIELSEKVGIPEGTLKIIPTESFYDNILIECCSITSLINILGNFSKDCLIPLDISFLTITNGKSPMIIFNNADTDAACDSLIDAAWGYRGFLPWSVNTLLVQEDIFQDVVDKLKYKLSKIKMSASNDKTADLAYPMDHNASEQLFSLINEAKLQGVEVFQTNEKTGLVQPTLLIGGRVFGNNVLKEDDNIAVVTVLGFRTATEAISLANNSRYGFGASIWTENIGLANEVARGIKASNIWINSHGLFSASIAFSPCKQSGVGNFGGSEGFYEYCHGTVREPKHLIFHSEVSTISESSSTIKDVYKYTTLKDFHNIIMVAKKGYLNWSKTDFTIRSQCLRSVANAISKNISQLCKSLNSNEESITNLIELLYDFPTSIKTGSSACYKSYNIQSYYDPVGVVVIDASDQIEDVFIRTILGCILLGNSVIVLCCSSVPAQFCIELSKLLTQNNISPGTFNVVTNCDYCVQKAASLDKEINLYIDIGKHIQFIRFNYMNPVYRGKMWTNILNRLLLIKNVWFNVGYSVL